MANKPWKILLLDDDKLHHDVVKMEFKREEFKGRKFDIFSRYSCIEGLKFMKDNTDTDIAIVDLTMEDDLSGLNFIRYIRDFLYNCEIKFIIRTGCVASMQHFINVGFDKFYGVSKICDKANTAGSLVFIVKQELVNPI